MAKIKFEKNKGFSTGKSLVLLKRQEFWGFKLVGDCAGTNCGKVYISACSGRRRSWKRARVIRAQVALGGELYS